MDILSKYNFLYHLILRILPPDVGAGFFFSSYFLNWLFGHFYDEAATLFIVGIVDEIAAKTEGMAFAKG